MSSTGKKEYTLVINGVSQGVTDVTKLEAAIKSLDGTIDKQRTVTTASTAAEKEKTKALTDEEKAAKKLADTQARITQVNSAANRAQILATQQLRDAARETARSVAINELAEGSIAQMGMQLTDLRNEYEALSVTQRNNADEGGKLLTSIQALDTEYKALRESTGNFRDSVGNYEKALKGLGDLKDGLDKVGNGSTNLAASVTGSNDVLDAFGTTASSVSKASEGLAGTIALATQAQAIYTAITEEGVIQQKASAIMSSIQATQLRAKAAADALATETTIGATIAQAAFNLVAAANPYVLIALAIIAVAAALYLFATSTDKSSEKQKEANAITEQSIEILKRYTDALDEAAKKRETQLQNEIDALTARNAKTNEIRKAEDALANERLKNNARLRGFYGQEIDDLDKNRKAVEQFYGVLAKLKIAQAKGDEKIKLDIDLDGKIDKVKIDDALTSVQGVIDNLGKKIQLATELKTDQQQIINDARVTAETRLHEDKELAKTQRAQTLEANRTLQDDVLKGQRESYATQRAEIKNTYNRQIEDLKVRLLNERYLSQATIDAINKDIVAKGKARNKALADLDKERTAQQLETTRAAEDSRTELIIGAQDRQIQDVKQRYQRSTEDLKIRLANEATLTKKQRSELNAIIKDNEILQTRELDKIHSDGLNNRNTAELSTLDETLAEERDRITKFTNDPVVRGKTGLKLIDVDATKKNLAETNKALDGYIIKLQAYAADLKTAHEATLTGLKKGTPEYQEEVTKYAVATEDVAKRIKIAQKEQKDNTLESTKTQAEFYKDLAEKVAQYAGSLSQVISGFTDTLNLGIQAQLDTMNAQLDTVTSKYADAQKMQEDAVASVQDTEAKLQAATGGTAIALKQQLGDQIAARNEAARNEAKLAKEKAKLEADIQKKEKQVKRNELIANIASTIANTAQAVVQALAAYPPPLSYVLAGVTGALGLVQVGIMTNQLTKLAKGGPIIGPSHSNGGVNLGSQYEVEGGEFVINKASYMANGGLIRFINDNPGVKVLDAPQADTPNVIVQPAYNSNADVIAAINGIDINPVVSVVDINTANRNLTAVQDLANFNTN